MWLTRNAPRCRATCARQRSDTQFTAYISYLELYNEQGYDLLDPSHETKSLEELPYVASQAMQRVSGWCAARAVL